MLFFNKNCSDGCGGSFEYINYISTVKSTSNMLTWRRQDARLSAGGRCPSTRPNPDPRDRERERRLDAKTILNVIVHHTVTNNIKFLTIGILHYNSPLPFYQQLSATMQELCKNRYNLQDFQKFRAKGFLQVTPRGAKGQKTHCLALWCVHCAVTIGLAAKPGFLFARKV